jgi:glycosyltransferase involved in cell wall biosynthesis
MVAMAVIRRREYEVTVVDLYSGRAFLWAEGVCGALRMIGKTFVLTLRGGNLPAFARRQPGRVRRLLRSAAAVTTPSHYLLEQMKPYGDDLRLLPNPLDLNIYKFKPRARPQCTLTWLRAFHATYNPWLAPRVVALLARDFTDIRLTMVGPDKGDGSLERTMCVAAELGVTDRVTLPGGVFKTEVPHWLNKADIFLNTTNVDNTPVSVLEAMACGLCVVSTNAGGIPYLLEHEHDALLVPPDDPEAMAAAVRRLMTEDGLAERISRNARRKVEQFDWSIILPQWETLLSDVAARSGEQ